MLFLVVLFLIKNVSVVKNSLNSVFNKKESGLAYTTTLKELVYKDEDGDGVPDWEEGLYGLDPTKKETTPGTPDSVAINKLKANQGDISATDNEKEENLTETDKFSRELFSSTAALNQSGAMDPNTADQLSSSLASKIQNSPQRKVFLLSDIKTTKDNSSKAIKNYSDALNNIQNKYPDKGTVTDVLQKFIIEENNVDSSVLVELNPIIKQTQDSINAILKMTVPQSLASLHLDFLNSGERLLENMVDMRLFDTDPIVAMGAMSKYEDNVISFKSTYTMLINTISVKN